MFTARNVAGWIRSWPLALLLLGLVLGSRPLAAQSVQDGLMVPKRTLGAGLFYRHESWDRYWEGTLERSNGNIGTFTTQSVSLMAGYGVSDQLTVLMSLPYVWTSASQGTFKGAEGIQDLSVAAKLRVLNTPFTSQGNLRVMLVGSAGLPATNYAPEPLPFAIGMASPRLQGRLTLDFEARGGWFLLGTAGYSWRGDVELDRESYYTDGQFYLSNEVDMPDVVEYQASAGYRRGRFYVPVSIFQQRTLGGGDIRRQDMPFVSNRMDYVTVDALVRYTVSTARSLMVQAGASQIVSGRNTGKATTLTAGLLHEFHF